MTGRRVLMIAHHFPPMGGSGANRALAFAKYLAEYGWQPIVLTPGAAWAANRDDRLLSELPASVRVIRTRSLEPRPATPKTTLDRSGPERSRAPAGLRLRLPGGVRSHLGHLRRFPDAHIGWLPCALAAARGLEYDVAYSSSGPFTSHLVGLLLARATRRPWLAELRDGWYCWNRAIFPDYPGWRDLLERRLESAVVRRAEHVVLVTDRMADAFRRQYADLAADHFSVVSNGFDPAQFEPSPKPKPAPGPQAEPERSPEAGSQIDADLKRAREAGSHIDGDPKRAPEPESQIEADLKRAPGREPEMVAEPKHAAKWDGTFRHDPVPWAVAGSQRSFEVVHAGALYYGRSMASFLEAAGRLVDSDPAFAAAFRLTLLGTLDVTARAELSRHPLGGRIHVSGQLDHAAAIGAMRAASLLLLISNTTPGAEATVPGKLFEYLAVGRPLLAIAPHESSTADVLTAVAGGTLVEPGDPNAIAGALRQAFSAHASLQSRSAEAAREALLVDPSRQVFAVDASHYEAQSGGSSLEPLSAEAGCEAPSAKSSRGGPSIHAGRQVFSADASHYEAQSGGSSQEAGFSESDLGALSAESSCEALSGEAGRQMFAADGSHGARAPSRQAVARFDRRVLSGELARLLDQVVDGAARRA